MRENVPLLSRVVDPTGTKGGPRTGNFSGPPKNTFLSRVQPPPGTKGPFVPGGGFTRDKRSPSYICLRLVPLLPTLGFLISAASPPPRPPSPIRCFSSAVSPGTSRSRKTSTTAPAVAGICAERHRRYFRPPPRFLTAGGLHAALTPGPLHLRRSLTS